MTEKLTHYFNSPADFKASKYGQDKKAIYWEEQGVPFLFVLEQKLNIEGQTLHTAFDVAYGGMYLLNEDKQVVASSQDSFIYKGHAFLDANYYSIEEFTDLEFQVAVYKSILSTGD